MERRHLRNEQVWLAVGSLMILATIAVAFALVFTRDVMIPFVLAIFITTVVAPFFDYQVVRLRFPRWVAVATTLLVVYALLSLLSLAFVAAFQAMVAVARDYGQQAGDLIEKVFDNLQSRHIQIDQAKIVAEIEDNVPLYVTQSAGVLMGMISHAVLVMIFVVFLLFGRDSHRRRVGIWADIERTFREYLVEMTIISTLTAILVGLVLWGLGLQMAWLFAFLVFILTYIPNVGGIVATLLPLPIAFAQFQNPWMIAAVVAIPAAIHMVIGNFVAPRLMAHGLELHPVSVLLSLAFWGLLWGVTGMFLAVPIMAMVRIVLAEFETTRPLAELLSGRLPGRGEVKTLAR
ncbi:AI-2E family transporter [Lacipirellula limnantheis]|uniref:AI-2 transport protein TqsA n=1 Tax=Lacipirellula limnantheis TaxID=2528024 RepID=A0A517TSY1_9BACT|nr:AI-2E family transporter [Lacipirellula limnantheis]QDT71485.1 AI-2 transport protein TqsA [Lacipirellula limnantheis]